jgi:hypothetical protein
MRRFKINTDFKIKLPIIIFSLFILIGILSYQFSSSNFITISTVISFLIIIVALLSMAGLYNTIKKIRKPITTKRAASVILMAIFGCILLYIIVENTFDAVKKFI